MSSHNTANETLICRNDINCRDNIGEYFRVCPEAKLRHPPHQEPDRYTIPARQTTHRDPMLFQCWGSCDAAPTLKQHRINIACVSV